LRWRLKWIFAAGLAVGVLAASPLCALNGKAWLLAAPACTVCPSPCFYYRPNLHRRTVGPQWRARAQALMTLMCNGVGNFTGYLVTGWWFALCARPAGTQWSLFWGVLAAAVAAVLVYF